MGISRFLPRGRFRLLPRANEELRPDGQPLILEVNNRPQSIKRWEAVYAATESLIATTTPGGRYLIVRGGFVTFQGWAKVGFKELSPFDFDANELRCMFEGIEAYRKLRGESRYNHRFERRYNEQLRRNPTPNQDVLDGAKPDITVDSIVDGSLKSVPQRVH